MNKNIIIAFFLFFSFLTQAQTPIIGVWKMTEMSIGGEKMQVNMHVDINQDGNLYISGSQLGTWEYNKADNTIIAQSEMQLDMINGVNSIKTISDTDLILVNIENGQTTFQRKSQPIGEEYKNKIVGEYLFTEILKEGKTEKVGEVVCRFDNNGIVYLHEMVAGTWQYNKKNKKLNIDAPKFEEISGENRLIKKGEELVFETPSSGTLFFKRINRDKITIENNNSGLLGLWKIEIDYSKLSEEVVEEAVEEAVEEPTEESGYENAEKYNTNESYIETNYMVFNNDNLYSYGQGNRGSSGMWIYDKKENTLAIIGRYIQFAGVNNIIELNDEKVVIKDKNGRIFTGVQIQQDAKNYDKLDFKEDEFLTVNEDSKSANFDINSIAIPWSDFNSNLDYLKNIKGLTYTYLKPVKYFDFFERKEVTSKFQYNREENQVVIDYIFDGYFGENPTQINYGELDFFEKPKFHPFFIFEDILSVKNRGQETITTPAGSFACTVIEGYSDWDKKTKLWIINDKPGVYAKIIKSEKTPFDEYDYSIFILKEIIK